MHKGDLVSVVAKKTNESKAAIERTVNAVLEAMSHELKAGKDITLIGFGTFKVANRAARTGVNPQTGAKINIKACKVVKFKPGKKLKESVK
jgi:DNA-binding protein HU-beta